MALNDFLSKLIVNTSQDYSFTKAIGIAIGLGFYEAYNGNKENTVEKQLKNMLNINRSRSVGAGVGIGLIISRQYDGTIVKHAMEGLMKRLSKEDYSSWASALILLYNNRKEIQNSEFFFETYEKILETILESSEDRPGVVLAIFSNLLLYKIENEKVIYFLKKIIKNHSKNSWAIEALLSLGILGRNAKEENIKSEIINFLTEINNNRDDNQRLNFWSEISLGLLLKVKNRTQISTIMKNSQDWYKQAGLLYNLTISGALINDSRKKKEIISIIKSFLNDDSTRNIEYHACICLGLLGMSCTENFDDISSILLDIIEKKNSASVGGAAIGLGLLVLGNDIKSINILKEWGEKIQFKLEHGPGGSYSNGLLIALSIINLFLKIKDSQESNFDSTILDVIERNPSDDSFIKGGALGLSFQTKNSLDINRLQKIIINNLEQGYSSNFYPGFLSIGSIYRKASIENLININLLKTYLFFLLNDWNTWRDLILPLLMWALIKRDLFSIPDFVKLKENFKNEITSLCCDDDFGPITEITFIAKEYPLEKKVFKDLSVFDELKHLKRICINGRRVLNDLDGILSFGDLEQLEIQDSQVKSLKIVGEKSTEKMTSLRILKINNADYLGNIDDLMQFPNLEEISFSRLGVDLSKLLLICKSLEHLKSIDIKGTPLENVNLSDKVKMSKILLNAVKVLLKKYLSTNIKDRIRIK